MNLICIQKTPACRFTRSRPFLAALRRRTPPPSALYWKGRPVLTAMPCLLNAAAALVVADHAASLAQGVLMAEESIDSGAALAKVLALARITQAA